MSGNLVFAGVDYAKILEEAEKEADIILWDGGNNDFPFYLPDLWITVTDPHRLGHETTYYPGHTNLIASDVVIINKIDTADPEAVKTLIETVKKENPNAEIINAKSPITVEDPDVIKGKRVLVIEDGPTLTHGDMEYGAGIVAAKKFEALEIVDPRPFAVRSIAETFNKYKHLNQVLPAMGYGDEQIKDLEETINKSDAEGVVIGTPIDLRRLLTINKPTTRVTYDMDDKSAQNLFDILKSRGLA
jgi:predicted GTPase